MASVWFEGEAAAVGDHIVNILDNVGGELASAIILISLTAAYTVFYSRYLLPSRRRRTIWRFTDRRQEEAPQVLIESVAGERTDLYQRPSIGYGAVAATGLVATALSGNLTGFSRMSKALEKRQTLVYFASDQMADNCLGESDSVVIGGPKSNRITAQILEDWGRQKAVDPSVATKAAAGNAGLGVATVGNTIHWYGSTVTGRVSGEGGDSRATHGYSGIDFGVIMRLPSPGSPLEHRVVVLFGSQTFGVYAATRWFVNALKQPREVTQILRTYSNLAILVRADVRNGVVREVSLVDPTQHDNDFAVFDEAALAMSAVEFSIRPLAETAKELERSSRDDCRVRN